MARTGIGLRGCYGHEEKAPAREVYSLQEKKIKNAVKECGGHSLGKRIKENKKS